LSPANKIAVFTPLLRAIISELLLGQLSYPKFILITFWYIISLAFNFVTWVTFKGIDIEVISPYLWIFCVFSSNLIIISVSLASLTSL
jgi:hypothetical protein